MLVPFTWRRDRRALAPAYRIPVQHRILIDEAPGRRRSASPHQRTSTLETFAVGRAADDPEHNLAEPFDRLRAGFAIGTGDASALILGKLPLELDAFFGQAEQPLTSIALAGALDDETLLDELAEHAAQALLRDLEDAEEFGDGHFGMPANEINDTMMGAAEAIARQYGVRPAGEVPVSVEEQ